MSDLTAYDHPRDAGFGDYVALLKPRVMSLVVFTAFVGLVVAPGAVHPLVAFVSILFIALGGGASGALNMWYDADIDAVMRRTKGRPVPQGRVSAGEALGLGLALSGLSVMMLGLAANWFAAGFLAFTIFFYAVVYTMWLKRSTPQNIVIGGAAGAFPPMIGWAVATGGVGIESILMFALIFMWTPPHFWALALFMKDDYSNAGVPMLTVTHGRRTTRRHILAYTLLLAPVALRLAFPPLGGPATRPRQRPTAIAPRRPSSASRSATCSCISARFWPTRPCVPPDGGSGRMALGRDHELHQRRFGRNLGLGLVLAGFVAIIFGLTVVKVSNGDMMEGYDHQPRTSLLPVEGSN